MRSHDEQPGFTGEPEVKKVKLEESTSRIYEMFLSDDDMAQFSVIQAAGFPVQDLLRFTANWPRVRPDFQLQVIADALLSHYRHHPVFADNFSLLLKALKESDKTTASYRLWKMISSWLHQQWTSLPCADLPNYEAYRLFPEHALAPPSIKPPDQPIQTRWIAQVDCHAKVLAIPLEWEGALDGFLPLLDVIPPPKSISVIGFGNGRELIAINKKWPAATIYGFEHSFYDQGNSQPDILTSEPNIKLCYHSQPESYKHHDDQPIDFALIRHPDSSSASAWLNIVLKVMDSLSADGTLLISFYSQKEMRALKKAFMNKVGDHYIWSEKVNPFAYNPSFMSKSAMFSFDLMLVTIRPKLSNQADFLERLSVGKTRRREESSVEVKPSCQNSLMSFRQ